MAEPVSPLSIAICVCTYRRPEVARTLASLSVLEVEPGWSLRIVIADNDERPSARARVEAAAKACPHPVTYLHSPASNISIARNACLDALTGDVCAFIDDDETAAADWLRELVTVARSTGADAVLGPVRARYGADAPGWMTLGDFHSTVPVFVEGRIRTGYTCNVLLDLRSPRLRGLRFNLARGRTGGEDTEFFSELHARGGRIAYAPQAFVDEAVPAERARFAWLRRRRFRMGQTHGRLLAARGGGPARQARQTALAVAKAAYAFAMSLATLPSPVRWRRNALRGILHAGVVSGLAGQREIVQYGATVPARGDVHAP